MKKSSLLLLVLISLFILPESVWSQDNKKITEIGIRTHDLRDLDFIYKKQKSENVYSRLRLLSGNIKVNDVSKFNGSFSMGIGIGREKRNPINDKLSFITGAEFIGSFSTSIANDKLRFTLIPGIGMVLGFSYLISDKLIIGIETIPQASFKLSNATSKLKLNDFDIEFNANMLEFFAMFRF